MRLFTEENAGEVVKERHAAAADPRLREIFDSLVDHLHGWVRAVEPTPEEWMTAIQFLTRTGQISSDSRQEFILLSDVLGVSMLVDAINNRRQRGETESTVLGPFYVSGAPELSMGDTIDRRGEGEPLLVSGAVCDETGAPIAGARIDLWQTAPNGLYDVQETEREGHNLRGVLTTGADGRYWFRTVAPVPYPIPDDGPVGDLLKAAGRHPMRPAHIHFLISAPGFRTLITHLFTDDSDYLDSDAVFGVKDSLVIALKQTHDPARAAELGLPERYLETGYDFVLARA